MGWRRLLIALSVVGLAGCSRTTTVSRDVIVDPPVAAVPLGKTLQFSNRGVAAGTTWTVVAPPGHGIISPSGLYRAPFFLPSTTSLTIEARAGARTARAQVELLDLPPDSSDCLGDPPDTGYVYVDELPEVIDRVMPAYPDAAREGGVQGTVIVHALVCDCGLIGSTRMVQSIPLLDQAAVSAIRQWVFRPAMSNGEAVAVWVAIPVRFTLSSPHAVEVDVGTIGLPGAF